MEITIRKALSEVIENALEISRERWDEVQADENCCQTAEVLEMLRASLEE